MNISIKSNIHYNKVVSNLKVGDEIVFNVDDNEIWYDSFIASTPNGWSNGQLLYKWIENNMTFTCYNFF